MKKTALVLATLLAATGAALAGDAAANLKLPDAQPSSHTAAIDVRSTGSVQPADESLRQAGTHAATAGPKKLGIDVNPWVMPVFH